MREQIEQMRDQKATWTPVEDKPLPGDMVRVQLATAEEYGEFPEAQEYPLVLGSGQAIPGVEELIMELKPGETAERSVRWPDDFPDEAQRGKTKTVRIHAARREAESRFPRSTTRSRAKSATSSRSTRCNATVRKDLEEHAEREADAGVRQQLIDQIVARESVRRSAELGESAHRRLRCRRIRFPKKSASGSRAEFRPVAERQVRRDLIIETIAERERLKATEADIDDRVAEVAEQARRRSGTGVRVAAEGRTSAGDRAEHHRGQSVQVAAGTKRSRMNSTSTCAFLVELIAGSQC